MSSDPTVSIIIATYDRPRWLSVALESAIHQHPFVPEVIVVDDGSPTDAAAAIVRQYPTVRYHYQPENHGAGAARNAGVRLSTGRYILFVDDDDWLTPGAVAERAALLDRRPEIGAVYSDLYLASADGAVTGQYYASFARPLPVHDIYPDLLLRNFIPLHALLWRRSILEALGGFPPMHGAEDWNLLVRAAEVTRFGYVDSPLGYYRLHGANTTLRYAAQVRGSALTQRYVADSPRFAELPPGRRARVLVSYGWQQWMDGDATLARDFLRRARAAAPTHPLPWLASALTLLGRPLARLMMRRVWALRARLRKAPSASGYFLRRV